MTDTLDMSVGSCSRNNSLPNLAQFKKIRKGLCLEGPKGSLTIRPEKIVWVCVHVGGVFIKFRYAAHQFVRITPLPVIELMSC